MITNRLIDTSDWGHFLILLAEAYAGGMSWGAGLGRSAGFA